MKSRLVVDNSKEHLVPIGCETRTFKIHKDPEQHTKLNLRFQIEFRKISDSIEGREYGSKIEFSSLLKVIFPIF